MKRTGVDESEDVPRSVRGAVAQVRRRGLRTYIRRLAGSAACFGIGVTSLSIGSNELTADAALVGALVSEWGTLLTRFSVMRSVSDQETA